MRFTHWLATGIAVAAVSVAASAQEDPKALFSARYAEFRDAMQAGDTAAMNKVITTDFSMTDIRGTNHDAAGLAALAQRMLGGGSERKTEAEVLKAVVTGPTAAVEYKLSNTMARPGPDGQPHQMQMIIVSDDTWVMVDGAWRLRASVQKDLTVLRDGEELFRQSN